MNPKIFTYQEVKYAVDVCVQMNLRIEYTISVKVLNSWSVDLQYGGLKHANWANKSYNLQIEAPELLS